MSQKSDELDEVLKSLKQRAPSYRRARQVDPNVRGGNTDVSASSSAVFRSKGDGQEAAISSSGTTREPKVADLAILVALPEPELDYVLRTFSSSWRQEGRDGILFNVGSMFIDDEEITVVAAVQNDMGMVPAAILATKTVGAWQPTLLAMVGVCAGVRGKVELGDIVIGQDLFDYGSGKLAQGRLKPDYRPVSIDESLCQLAVALARERDASAAIRSEWPIAEAGKPTTDLRVHVGAMASGAAVVADDGVVAGVEEHKRSLLAVDMEAYGLARAAGSAIMSQKFLVVKGVQDFADEAKNDEFREYAAFVSAHWLHRFVLRYWKELGD